mgnify:CR=1 FL=1
MSFLMDKNNNLGTERIGRLLRSFALPCTLSLIISCLYNLVDQIFVGNGVGYLGNAATGIVFPITVIGWAAASHPTVPAPQGS